MQSIRQSDMSVKNATTTQAVPTLVNSAPIVLDLAVLDHVAGGSPNGTWAASSVAVSDSPNGTW